MTNEEAQMTQMAAEMVKRVQADPEGTLRVVAKDVLAKLSKGEDIGGPNAALVLVTTAGAPPVLGHLPDVLDGLVAVETKLRTQGGHRTPPDFIAVLTTLRAGHPWSVDYGDGTMWLLPYGAAARNLLAAEGPDSEGAASA